ncbi:MAG: TetR/AcrR family transcriptional regulator [Actinomycetota bacterium]
MTLAIDDDALEAVARLLDRGGLAELSISAIAAEAGVSRVTLHRRGPSVDDYVVALMGRVSDELRAELWPTLTAATPGAVRLRQALGALCTIAERRGGVMQALYGMAGRPIPGDPERTTNMAFAEPFERLIRDGCLDGSLHSERPADDAPLLVNVVGWTYIQMRRAHGWPEAKITEAAIDLAMTRVAPPTQPASGSQPEPHR